MRFASVIFCIGILVDWMLSAIGYRVWRVHILVIKPIMNLTMDSSNSSACGKLDRLIIAESSSVLIVYLRDTRLSLYVNQL